MNDYNINHRLSPKINKLVLSCILEMNYTPVNHRRSIFYLYIIAQPYFDELELQLHTSVPLSVWIPSSGDSLALQLPNGFFLTGTPFIICALIKEPPLM